MENGHTEAQERRVLDAAMEAGHILLENGAEISRVEETMERICKHYGVDTGEFFVLSNGIFTTAGHSSDKTFARVQHIPVKGANLNKVIAVNQLSREIAEGKHERIDDVEDALSAIRQMRSFPAWQQILASGLSSGFFCALFGGGTADCLAAFATGLILYIYILKVSMPYLSKIVGNIFGGMIIVLVSLACHHIGLGINMSHMISGSIMPLIPGVAFTNGIRDIADGDYISGAVRVLDAVLIFLSIAIGMGTMFMIYHSLTGGMMP